MRHSLQMAVILLFPLALSAQPGAVPYTPGMVITASTRIAPGSYLAPSGDAPAITIRGSGLTLDMRGVELVGNADRLRPDLFRGFGIVVEDGHDVTIRGATVRGYKIALLVRRTANLRVLDNDFSHNWKPRLFSGIEKESLIDWMSFHQNDGGEWIAAGSAIYLHGVEGGEIRGNTVRQGSSALMMSQTNGVKVWNNDFSYNSALGIAMYRSSRNTIMHNRIDYNVRGYSHGFYNRGQDSAGILMYEQCMDNVVAFNSVTHSGDGLFIWAGQSTMDSGEGGVNGNLFFGNDFSHAPTNGIENTFSSNVFVNNRIEENWHGVWGGYSWQTVFLGNRFRGNDEAITIEHGQDIRIVGNSFAGDTTAVRIWQNPTEPADWGYPQHRDTRSRDYVILGNTFSDIATAFQVTDSRNVRIDGNIFRGVDTLTRTRGDTARWSFTPTATGVPAPVPIPAEYRVSRLPGGIDAMIPRGVRRGRKTIIVDEWGPYDWQSPKLWPVGRSDASPQRLRVLGPAGNWRVVGLEGVASLSAETGRVGDTLTVVPTGGRENDWRVELEYTGPKAFTTRFGEPVAADQPWRFGWTRFEPNVAWHVSFAAADSTGRPIPPGFREALAALDTTRLDLTWYRPPIDGVPQANIATEALGRVTLPPGRYRLRSIADDAIRVWVDDALLIDDWHPGESHAADAEFEGGGRHTVLVMHWQKDGWYELRLDIERLP